MGKDKNVHKIITSFWNLLKPFTTAFPESDDDWDRFHAELNRVTAELEAGASKDEKKLIYGMSLAVMNYMQQREAMRSTSE